VLLHAAWKEHCESSTDALRPRDAKFWERQTGQRPGPEGCPVLVVSPVHATLGTCLGSAATQGPSSDDTELNLAVDQLIVQGHGRFVREMSFDGAKSKEEKRSRREQWAGVMSDSN
jgi:hypothetical protein